MIGFASTLRDSIGEVYEQKIRALEEKIILLEKQNELLRRNWRQLKDEVEKTIVKQAADGFLTVNA